MGTLPQKNNSNAVARMVWYRRLHRWLGIAALVFLLLLAVTGIALNHVSDWQLDRRYVGWSWLLDVYGIEAPQPSASFSDGGHRATLMGDRLYVDAREVARDVDGLAGIVATEEFLVVAAHDSVLVLTNRGELVERLQPELAAAIPFDAAGIANERVVLARRDGVFRFDRAMLDLEPWEPGDSAAVRWSAASQPAPGELEALQDLYRGRGVTIERLLADLHSGRILTRIGPWLMDLAGVLLIVLSVTGFIMWRRGGNGVRRGRPVRRDGQSE